MTTKLITTYGTQTTIALNTNREMQALASVYSLLLQKSREKQAKTALKNNGKKDVFISTGHLGSS